MLFCAPNMFAAFNRELPENAAAVIRAFLQNSLRCMIVIGYFLLFIDVGRYRYQICEYTVKTVSAKQVKLLIFILHHLQGVLKSKDISLRLYSKAHP